MNIGSTFNVLQKKGVTEGDVNAVKYKVGKTISKTKRK